MNAMLVPFAAEDRMNADDTQDASHNGAVSAPPPHNVPTETPAERIRAHQWNSETARAAGEKGKIAKAAKKAEREARALDASLTVRQRLGLSVSKLTQDELDAAVHALVVKAATGDARAIHALARVLDQAFGKAGDEAPADPRDMDERAWEEWSPAERAQYRAALLAKVKEGREAELRATEHTPTTQGDSTHGWGQTSPSNAATTRPATPSPRGRTGQGDAQC
jgi:hypothetical protein